MKRNRVHAKKYCAVKGCRNGLSDDRNARKDAGLKQVTLFRVPTDTNSKKKWRDALNQSLGDNDAICESHFKDEDVLRDKIYDLPNGETIIEPRKRHDLVKNAVPFIGLREDANRSVAAAGDFVSILDESTLDSNEFFSKQSERLQDATNGHTSSTTNKATHDRHESNGDFFSILDESTTDSHAYFYEHAKRARLEPSRSGETCVPHNTNSNTVVAAHTSQENDSNTAVDDVHESTNVELSQNLTSKIPQFSFNKMIENLNAIPVTRQGWSWHKSFGKIEFIHVVKAVWEVRCILTCYENCLIQGTTIDGSQIPGINGTLTSMEDLEHFQMEMERTVLCEGIGVEAQRSVQCTIKISTGSYHNMVPHPRCKSCKLQRKRILDRRSKRASAERQEKVKMQDTQRELELLRSKAKRYQSIIKKERATIKYLLEENRKARSTVLEEEIATLPEPIQQEIVRLCFDCRYIDPRQRRYKLDFIYECVLMRIKSPKLYNHIRERKILPLPSKQTIDKYIRKVQPIYGFQPATFECLGKKGSRMELPDKRGVLLVDEVALSEAVGLDRRTMEIQGITDMSKYTHNQKGQRGDHALVIMFQPFRGKWVQVLGCFLTKHSVTSEALHKILIECIILLGNAGFFVDAIVMDGATWNRGVWEIFGIHLFKLFCPNPFNPSEKLWFISDFPHLIKCLRNLLMKLIEFLTPDGVVKKKHWESLLLYENHLKATLKMAYKLTPAHLNPVGYQKMNVPMAYYVYSKPVACAMGVLKNEPELQDCDPTIEFINRLSELIEVMSSRTPASALRYSDDCRHKKVIKDFIKFLDDWEALYPKNFPLSGSTLKGLRVTLKSTLELMDYLHNRYNFDYLMLCRLNQDNLERFFSIIRAACGSNEHPDPMLFAALFRLLSCYSLIKPIKGSNVEGSELLHTLMQTKDSFESDSSKKTKWFAALDELFEVGATDYDNSNDVGDHDYDIAHTHQAVLEFMSGYLAHKSVKFTAGCTNCIATLETDDRELQYRFIDLMDRGNLKRPTTSLVNFLTVIENSILEVVGTRGINIDTLFQVLDNLKSKVIPRIGCADHCESLTKKLLNFYVVMRGSFLCDSINESCSEKKRKSKQNRKMSKL